MIVAGLFSGIGGLELPFVRRGLHASVMCDIWEPSRQVLSDRFSGVTIHSDIRDLDDLPAEANVITAGFPCTDLSQAGRTAGIGGSQSSLVGHVFRLIKNHRLDWLVLENVRNMLVLDGGSAMSYLVTQLESLGFRWAYRLVDTRFTGLPQRRHRVLLVASRTHDPCEVLFADDASEGDRTDLRDDAFGFYWTEGLGGLGWARDSIPPLKAGSTVGIPSPPAIWLRNAPLGHRIVVPSISDAEALQGFPRDWTMPARHPSKNGPRWKLVGNAVSVNVAQWLVDRLCSPGPVIVPGRQRAVPGRWPEAASGGDGTVWVHDASTHPRLDPYVHLTDLLAIEDATPLSARATAGFLSRASRSTLTFDPEFLRDMSEHGKVVGSPGQQQLPFADHAA